MSTLEEMFGGVFGRPSEPTPSEQNKTIAKLRQANEQQAEMISRLQDKCSKLADRCLDLQNAAKRGAA